VTGTERAEPMRETKRREEVTKFMFSEKLEEEKIEVEENLKKKPKRREKRGERSLLKDFCLVTDLRSLPPPAASAVSHERPVSFVSEITSIRHFFRGKENGVGEKRRVVPLFNPAMHSRGERERFISPDKKVLLTCILGPFY